jgi:hypothetical protein
MRRIFGRIARWLKQRANTFDLFPDYLKAVYSRWHDYLWGALFVAPIIIWWMVDTPPMSVIAWTFVFALVVAGYYAWRADHLRLLPKLAFTPEVFLTPYSTVHSVVHFCQVLPKCLTETVVEECQGYLLRVMKWEEDHWVSTALNEPLDLTWSFRVHALDNTALTLKPNVDQKLNIFSVDSFRVSLCVANEPLIAQSVFTPNDTFRFDIIVTAKECPPISISIKALIGEQTNDRFQRNLPLPVVVGIIDGKQNSN